MHQQGMGFWFGTGLVSDASAVTAATMAVPHELLEPRDRRLLVWEHTSQIHERDALSVGLCQEPCA